MNTNLIFFDMCLGETQSYRKSKKESHFIQGAAGRNLHSPFVLFMYLAVLTQFLFQKAIHLLALITICFSYCMSLEYLDYDSSLCFHLSYEYYISDPRLDETKSNSIHSIPIQYHQSLHHYAVPHESPQVEQVS